MTHEVTLIPGDWIGPETCAVVQLVLDGAGADIRWDVQPLTVETLDRVVESARRTGTVLSARVETRREAGQLPPTVELRKRLGVFSSIRPVRALPYSNARFPDLDLFVVRELSEDIYAGFEHEVTDGVYEAIKITTKEACERIARWTYQVARKHGRERVTIVHKSNIMKRSDGLFLATALEVGKEFPEIRTDEVIVDALCMKLVRWPGSFDVLLSGNLFGDIVSDLVSGLAGGITASATSSYGEGVAIFSNPHGRAEDLVGRDLANPIPMLLSSLWMLRHLGELALHDRVYSAMMRTLADGVRTRDMGGSATCTELGAGILARL